jgi:proteasome lid subunit RPN8/RPN11
MIPRAQDEHDEAASKRRTPRARSAAPALRFAPLAWLKLQMFLHAGETEVGGFGISRPDDLLYLERFETVKQRVSAASVELDDSAVADYFDDCVDRGLQPRQCARIWLHTHPGQSPRPSHTDEQTFERVFGRCDWSVMFIIGRTGSTYARLRLGAGPGGSIELPVVVDWSTWPQVLFEQGEKLAELAEGWMDEYGINIHPVDLRSRLGVLDDPWRLDDIGHEFGYGDRHLFGRAEQYRDALPVGEEALWP